MNLLEDLHSIMEQEMQETFKVPGWKMREIPWLSIELFQEFIDIVGSENIKIISGSRRQETRNGEVSDNIRCTCLLSPEAFERLREFNSPSSNR